MDGQPDAVAQRVRVLYTGRVQGVCFRATAAELAGDYRVTGTVRNLRTGQVELEAEGPPDEVERFLAAVAACYRANITSAQRTPLPARCDEARFEIRM